MINLFSKLVCLGLIAVLMTACGEDTSSEAGPSAFCSMDSVFCASFLVEPESAHSFRKFSLLAFEEEVPTRPPDVILAEILDPEIVDGEVRVEVELLPYRGDYYIWGILYNDADISPMATPELDYVGQTALPIALDGKAINLDPISLDLVPAE